MTNRKKTILHTYLPVTLVTLCGLLFALDVPAQVDEKHDHERTAEQAGHADQNSKPRDLAPSHGEHKKHEGFEHHAVAEDSDGKQEDHDHDEPVETGHEGHDHGQEAVQVHIGKSDRELAGIMIDQVRSGNITRTIELPGEVGLNEDNVAHIVPRFPGIVHKINKKLGNYVFRGDVLAVIESNESLTTYEVTSLLAGTVIEKHIALGEYVSEESVIFTIANLSTVWVNLAVYVNNTSLIRKGQEIMISQIGNDVTTSGTISYLSPVLDHQTRSALARVVIANRDSRWKPGTFVRGSVLLKTEEEGPVIDIHAVQTVNEKTVVFVPLSSEIFVARPVVPGETDGTMVHVVEGLAVGEDYVRQGAFELKAKIITSTLDSHAGHGH